MVEELVKDNNSSHNPIHAHSGLSHAYHADVTVLEDSGGEPEAHSAAVAQLDPSADPAVLALAAVPGQCDGVVAHVRAELRPGVLHEHLRQTYCLSFDGIGTSVTETSLDFPTFH